MTILDYLDTLDIGLLFKMVQNWPQYTNGPKWSYGFFQGKFLKSTFFWDTQYRTSNRAWTSLWQQQHSLRLGCQHQCQEGTSVVDVKESIPYDGDDDAL